MIIYTTQVTATHYLLFYSGGRGQHILMRNYAGVMHSLESEDNVLVSFSCTLSLWVCALPSSGKGAEVQSGRPQSSGGSTCSRCVKPGSGPHVTRGYLGRGMVPLSGVPSWQKTTILWAWTSWPQGTPYAFPPVPLIPPLLYRINALVALDRHNSVWFPEVVFLAIADLREYQGTSSAWAALNWPGS